MVSVPDVRTTLFLFMKNRSASNSPVSSGCACIKTAFLAPFASISIQTVSSLFGSKINRYSVLQNVCINDITWSYSSASNANCSMNWPLLWSNSFFCCSYSFSQAINNEQSLLADSLIRTHWACFEWWRTLWMRRLMSAFGFVLLTKEWTVLKNASLRNTSRFKWT